MKRIVAMLLVLAITLTQLSGIALAEEELLHNQSETEYKEALESVPEEFVEVLENESFYEDDKYDQELIIETSNGDSNEEVTRESLEEDTSTELTNNSELSSKDLITEADLNEENILSDDEVVVPDSFEKSINEKENKGLTSEIKEDVLSDSTVDEKIIKSEEPEDSSNLSESSQSNNEALSLAETNLENDLQESEDLENDKEINENGNLSLDLLEMRNSEVVVKNYLELVDAISAAPIGNPEEQMKIVIGGDIVVENKININGGKNILLVDDGEVRTFRRSEGFKSSMLHNYAMNILTLQNTSTGKLVFDGENKNTSIFGGGVFISNEGTLNLNGGEFKNANNSGTSVGYGDYTAPIHTKGINSKLIINDVDIHDNNIQGAYIG